MSSLDGEVDAVVVRHSISLVDVICGIATMMQLIVAARDADEAADSGVVDGVGGRHSLLCIAGRKSGGMERQVTGGERRDCECWKRNSDLQSQSHASWISWYSRRQQVEDRCLHLRRRCALHRRYTYSWKVDRKLVVELELGGIKTVSLTSSISQ